MQQQDTTHEQQKQINSIQHNTTEELNKKTMTSFNLKGMKLLLDFATV